MRGAAVAITMLALAGCDGAGEVSRDEGLDASAVDVTPNEYLAIETALLDGDLVRFDVAMRGADSEPELLDYANCAAAQYAQIRGYGFARLVRVNVALGAGISRADAVYTISRDEPRGVDVIAAAPEIAVCRAQGIPTV